MGYNVASEASLSLSRKHFLVLFIILFPSFVKIYLAFVTDTQRGKRDML